VRTRTTGPQRRKQEQDGAITERLKPGPPVIASTVRLNTMRKNVKRVSSRAKAPRKQSFYVGAKAVPPLNDRLFPVAEKPCPPVVASKVRLKRLRENAETGCSEVQRARVDAGQGKLNPYRGVEAAPRLRRSPMVASAFRLRECTGARS
jgi:hypothetical protein